MRKWAFLESSPTVLMLKYESFTTCGRWILNMFEWLKDACCWAKKKKKGFPLLSDAHLVQKKKKSYTPAFHRGQSVPFSLQQKLTKCIFGCTCKISEDFWMLSKCVIGVKGRIHVCALWIIHGCSITHSCVCMQGFPVPSEGSSPFTCESICRCTRGSDQVIPVQLFSWVFPWVIAPSHKTLHPSTHAHGYASLLNIIHFTCSVCGDALCLLKPCRRDVHMWWWGFETVSVIEVLG